MCARGTKDKIVYTLTFHGVLNVGALLQAYALQKYIEGLGYSSQIINYMPPYFIWQVYRPAKGLRKTFEKLVRIYKYRKFVRSHLNVTREYVFGLKGLRKFSSCRAVVVGSDQVWNKELTGGVFDPVFFLADNSFPRKIAYAASSGGLRLSQYANEVAEHLSDFESIGLREVQLCEDLKDIGLSGARVVVDPTLLISDYAELEEAGRVPSERYIVSYEVSEDRSRAQLAKIIEAIKERTGLPVYHLGAKPMICADHNLVTASIGEWISFVKNAALVCTNSFHGVAFALNYQLPFVAVSHYEEEKNARVKNLLKLAQLEHLCVTRVAELERRDLFSPYNKRHLDAAIDNSKSFLETALAGSVRESRHSLSVEAIS